MRMPKLEPSVTVQETDRHLGEVQHGADTGMGHSGLHWEAKPRLLPSDLDVAMEMLRLHICMSTRYTCTCAPARIARAAWSTSRVPGRPVSQPPIASCSQPPIANHGQPVITVCMIRGEDMHMLRLRGKDDLDLGQLQLTAPRSGWPACCRDGPGPRRRRRGRRLQREGVV